MFASRAQALDLFGSSSYNVSMFSWRSRRQLVIFLVVISPLVVTALYVIKKVIPEPTCFDNRINQTEMGVDCGGPCISCALKNPRPVTVFWTRAVPVRENIYDVAAEIENPNEFLSSIDIEYEFTLLDDFGPIAQRRGKTYLYAQERTMIIEANIETVRKPNRTEFKIVNVYWQEKKASRPSLIAERREYKVIEDRGRRQSLLEITLFNQSSFDFSEIELGIAVLDRDENLLGVNRITVEHLLSQSRRIVKSQWPEELSGDVAIIKIEPRVNTFNPRVILPPR